MVESVEIKSKETGAEAPKEENNIYQKNWMIF